MNKPDGWFPPRTWLAAYTKADGAADILAGVIVAIMLIPQSLAYALLAGLPPEMGLYASILPLIAYALLGTSRTLSVGPVAVISLMTASALARVTATGEVDYASAAIALAALSGVMLVGMGFLRFGFLANFLSHPVVSGFITASGIIIALSQLSHLLGITGSGSTLPALLSGLVSQLSQSNVYTALTGIGVLTFLLWSRKGLEPLLIRLGTPTTFAAILARAGPVFAILATAWLSYRLHLGDHGVALVGAIPAGLPALSAPPVELSLWRELAVSALLISIIGFVESVSVGKTLAAKRRQRIDHNQELVALGSANIAASISGGFPVTGGFSRSVVNFDAGAHTQAASIFAAAGIALTALFLTPALLYLPKATLAATIIVAVISLLDIKVLAKAWRYARSDFFAVSITIIVTLIAGVEIGVLCGITSSILLHLHKTTRPHVAVVGTVPGTEHYRNTERHEVITYPSLVSIRIDESLYFANAGYLEDYIYRLVAEQNELKHVILQCTAVNEIDMSALEMLESVVHSLAEQGITLNLSEVKGPVMDALKEVNFPSSLSGKIYLSHHQAVKALRLDEPEPYII
ncbi:sulfate permease [Halioglobus maricola]|uniref:Sulfate permease n=1 Tax=Halioglobus maricola TaxID=2601894 RepID=A0A5P9NL49_9GAMM|nr:sulfate permease [Halioglobus maricola]QFU75964.1 sulfate permease [Halioglobus maricola]